MKVPSMFELNRSYHFAPDSPNCDINSWLGSGFSWGLISNNRGRPRGFSSLYQCPTWTDGRVGPSTRLYDQRPTSPCSSLSIHSYHLELSI
jgi:hypothetical protein